MEIDGNSGKDIAFESAVMGEDVPSNYVPAVEKGFYEALETGTLSGNAIWGARVVLHDGTSHAVDSSELAVRLAATVAFCEAHLKTRPS
jgi:elongation factor G